MDNNGPKFNTNIYKNRIETIQLTQNFGENANIKYDESINKQILFNMIKPISSFTGRKKELIKINKSVLKNKITVVSGFGGIGKTELVRFYSYKNKTNNNVVWINAELESSLNTLFKKLAVELFVALQHNGTDRLMSEIIRDIYLKLNNRKCLIIFDNARLRTNIEAYLPQSDDTNVRVIITSQKRDLVDTASVIDLDVLNAEDASEFLATYLQKSCNVEENKTNIAKLAKELQYLPLALQQAVACINFKILDLNEEFSVLKYIEEFEKKKMFNYSYDRNLPFPDSNENSYDKTLFRSVALSVDLIEKSSSCPDLTLDILHVCSYLSPNNIPKSIFNYLEEDQDQLNKSLLVLTDYSLLEKIKNKDQWQYNIHRLVQLSYRYIKNPDGFCPKTAKKTLLLTTKKCSSNVYHYMYVLDLIMKDKKHSCEFYFDDTMELTIDKLCYYEFLKSIPAIIETFVNIKEIVDNSKGEKKAYYARKLRKYRDSIEKFVLGQFKISTDLFKHPTSDAAEKLHETIIRAFDDTVKLSEDSLKNKIYQALFFASYIGHLNLVQHIKDKGFYLDMIGPNKITPLFLAAQNGHKDLVQYFVENECDINARIIIGASPLYSASLRGHFQIVQYLMANEADLNITTNELLTPLHAAAQNGHENIVRLLVDKGAKVNQGTRDGLTALYFALNQGHLKIVQFLKENGAEIRDIFLDRAAHAEDLEVIKFLVKNGCNINNDLKNGAAPLFIASMNGHLQVVQYLIEQGANINQETNLYQVVKVNFTLRGTLVDNVNKFLKTKISALCIASLNGHSEIVQYLVGKGADINQCTDKEFTPEICAANNGHKDIVRYLVEKNIDRPALFVAAFEGHIDTVKLLVENDAVIDQKTIEMCTPLHGAATNGHKEVVEYLVDKGSDVNAIDNNGLSPVDMAYQAGHYSLVQYLLENGSKLSKINTIKMRFTRVNAMMPNCSIF